MVVMIGTFLETAVCLMRAWSSVEMEEDPEKKSRLINLKLIYESAMLNGPFAILAGFEEGVFTLTDNTKLRPMVVGHGEDCSYFASEVSALYEMEENLTKVETPRAGQHCIVRYETKKQPCRV